VRDMSCSSSSSLAYFFCGAVLFGKEFGLILFFLAPILALREASVIFFSIKTSGFVDSSSSQGKITRFPPLTSFAFSA
jgi:hypothetical protein